MHVRIVNRTKKSSLSGTVCKGNWLKCMSIINYINDDTYVLK